MKKIFGDNVKEQGQICKHFSKNMKFLKEIIKWKKLQGDEQN